MTNEITQTERCENEEFEIVVHKFQDSRCIFAVSSGATSFNLHLGYGDLVLLGDAIQRMIAGEGNCSETKDEPIIVGS